jgi:uncharacterized NAD(P)/FAD-binding protein YdhS
MGRATLSLANSEQEVNDWRADRRVAVIGAGFSGTMAALHLAAMLPPEYQVLLCERGRFGRGAAYSTPFSDHLLNVRAANMSAFSADPDHFLAWLSARPAFTAGAVRETAAGSFASRSLYGHYLSGLLDTALAKSGPGRLRLHPAEVVDLEPSGAGYRLIGRDGTAQRVAAAVLAVGNLLPPPTGSPLHCLNPWEPASTGGLRQDLPVLVIGTGLTMIDLVLQMRGSGFAGKIVALSRRGLLPQRHQATIPWPAPRPPHAERHSLLALFLRVRREVREAAALGVDWRSVIDSLRPITADLWSGLPVAERARFLRHLRPYWEVHRHRIAEPPAEQIAAQRARGDLVIERGRVLDLRLGEASVEVVYRLHNATQPVQLTVQRVINATGLGKLSEAATPLIAALAQRGLVRLDPLGLGLDITPSLQAVGGVGQPTPNLWAVGPLVRGALWECTAVPDIRAHAERAARAVATSLHLKRPDHARPAVAHANGVKSAVALSRAH